ncbi:GGDEF domain-containing protein [Acidithrix ferrooxidans]|uniref:Putative diguanylate cyclase YegE n=1 Tax=Acidithrix ferrooxidans TaxID=1280514 RepID=A0A0D8HGR2_9ACTN|nr:GGDEF domain-containing protein [Acidithrix ferrooxidans]KJF17185.1 putative diguanylate cyclase YegE [Acidithrix ferrooxidans]
MQVTTSSDRELLGSLRSFLTNTEKALILVAREEIIWINNATATRMATAAIDIIGQRLDEITTIEIPTKLNHAQNLEGELVHATGITIPISCLATPLSNSEMMLEITDRTEFDAHHELALYQERLWVLANQIPIGIFYSEVGLRTEFANDFLAQIYQSPVETLLGTGWIDQIPPISRPIIEEAVLKTLSGVVTESEIDLVTFSGTTKRILYTISPIISGDGRAGFAGTAEDITDRCLREEQMAHAATHDPLTGLPNRAAMMNDLYSHHQALTNKEIKGITVIFCDLNDFKVVNDSLGHKAGDRILIEAANGLRYGCRDGNLAYRYAGDEFVVLCPGIFDEVEATTIIAELKSSMEAPVHFANTQIRISGSFGSFTSSDPAISPEELLNRADASMYGVKQHSKQRHEG